jgi:acyl-CoA thioesterase-1
MSHRNRANEPRIEPVAESALWVTMLVGFQRMDRITLYLASGDALYPGMALLVLAIVVSPFLKSSWTLRSRNVVVWVASVLIVIASPPFGWVVDAIFLAVLTLWFIARNRTTPGRAMVRLGHATGVLLLALALGLSVAELLYRRMPTITGQTSDHLVVIGDSLSSGIDPRVPAWPTVMQQTTGIPITNLALPGATTAEGMIMAKKVAPEDRLVLIEIGGNDVLGGVPCDVFGKNLETILRTLAGSGRTVVMFELPLLPHKIVCGQYQRRLAAKYGTFLIPRRYLIDIIGGADATVDGLHLTRSGSRRMAALVEQALSAVLKAPAT